MCFLSIGGWEPQNTMVRKTHLCPLDVSIVRASFPLIPTQKILKLEGTWESSFLALLGPREVKEAFFKVTLLEESLEPTPNLFPPGEETTEMITY